MFANSISRNYKNDSMNATKSQIWRGLVNEVGTAIQQHNGYIPQFPYL